MRSPLHRPFERLSGALDSLWSSIDLDEPAFCDCRESFTCPDCSLAAPVGGAEDWPAAATPLPAA